MSPPMRNPIYRTLGTTISATISNLRIISTGFVIFPAFSSPSLSSCPHPNPHPLTMDYDRSNDSRYDGSNLDNIPSTRNSVYHARELTADPAKPRSYFPGNGILPPASFLSATESRYFRQPFVLLGSAAHRTLPIYREIHPDSPTHPSFRFNRLLGRVPKPYHPISPFPLFNLSEEAVGGILSYLTGADLASLALVDKDCRQLARTRQFRSVFINFSTASMALLTALVEEGRERVASTFKQGHNRWRLGACIQRITVCQEALPNEEEEKEKQRAATRTWFESRMKTNAAVEFHASHMNALVLVLRVAVPNLQFLDWKDRIPITPLIGSAIVGSRITKLELHHIILSKDFALDQDQFVKANWQIRCLLLNITVAGFHAPHSTNFVGSILRLAAPTLEELIWSGSGFSSTAQKQSLGEKQVQFPNLRKLQLSWVIADDTVWSALIPANENPTLVQIWLDFPDTDLMQLLARRGHISSLAHLICIGFNHDNLPKLVSFITANPQLQSFRHGKQIREYSENPLPGPISEGHHRLLPIFNPSSFLALTSLALVWTTLAIPPMALRSIAAITTLQRLWLSAGCQGGQELDWLVDHKILRKRLRPLKLLQWLVLTNDGYAHRKKDVWGYQRPDPGLADHHRVEMMRYACLLATGHPMLEWVHLGQLPMAVERSGVAGEPTVVPLQEQEDLFQLLGEMWGQYRVNWVYQN